MKLSLAWLQTYFEEALPSGDEVVDALTFHVAEVEEHEGDLLDVNVLPDRAPYMLSHRGVARELSSILDRPLARDPLTEALPEYPASERLSVTLDEAGVCARYIGALVTGVAVGPSPAWLKEALEAVGQRSINNVVDATNYVMLNIGQPLHAFDADKLTARDRGYAITIRGSREGESIVTLTGEEYALPEGTLLITDGNDAGTPLGIAGVKGGMHAKVDESTTSLILESGSFDAVMVRRTAQALKLFTDASARFQNKPSPSLASYGMRDVIALIQDVAGGTLEGVTDVFPSPPEPAAVSVSRARVNELLGTSLSSEDLQDALRRLGFSYTEVEGTFVVIPPFERADIVIPEDLVEEIGRIIGYDRIAPEPLPERAGEPDQARFRGIEAVRDFLVERGFAEVSTPSFAAEGEILLANPLQSDRPYLRATLIPNLKDALTRAASVAPRVLGPESFVKLFEVGTVFLKGEEKLILGVGIVPLAGSPAAAAAALKEYVATLEQELFQKPGIAHFSLDGQLLEIDIGALDLEALGAGYAPITLTQGMYRPYSVYPFMLRDIAVWTPEGTSESEVSALILRELDASGLLARIDLFDRFEKDGRTSFAFRLVFEAMDRTLSDADIDPLMERVTHTLNTAPGFEVR